MITAIFFTIAIAVAIVLMTWVCLIAVQSIAAFFPLAPHKPTSAARRPTVVVLMPAHNEAEVIQKTVTSLLPMLAPSDRLLVVADNCDDETSKLAASAGAWVVPRTDAVCRGKGYALAFGLQQLKAAPPDVVVVLDADCMMEVGGLETLVCKAAETRKPVQALYLMNAEVGAGLKMRIAAFAWAFKNQVRAAGFARLGLPCQLMGSGMAFPWSIVQKVEFATGHIVEDIKLGLDFAQLKLAPIYLPSTAVNSSFPSSDVGVQSQRKRWEHGHLAMLLYDVPRNLWKALKSRNFHLLVLTLDMSVPPLALLSLLVSVFVVLAGLVLVAGYAWGPIQVLALLMSLLFTITIGLAWLQVGRKWISALELAMVPVYILSKLPVYGAFLWRRQTTWIKTKR